MIKRILLLLSLSFIYFINAQTAIDRAIQNLESNYAQEKVYLLFDKGQYLHGENILFKSYVFDGYHLSSISTTLFVEFYDNDKNLLDKKTILLKQGEGDGSFTLAETLEENVYYFRAYTPLMANFPEEFQTIKPVLVYNPKSAKRLQLKENNEWTANLFPEGGTFISDLPTKFAIRLNNTGIGSKNWSGYVVDVEKPNEKLTSFKVLDENVATFTITGRTNKKYQAVVEGFAGIQQKIDLPEVLNNGISLQVKSDKNGIYYKIDGNKLFEDLKNYKIVGTINNQLAYKATIVKPIKEFSTTIKTDINEGLNGVLLLTVFNENDIVVAQRLCFIKPDDLYIKKPSLLGLPLNNSARTINELSISQAEPFDNYFVAVKSVEDINDKEESDKNNILSTLWLTGDFTSKIENPAQYFSTKDHAEALDALLISEKWNRFDWKNLISGAVPIIKHKTLPYLSYKGKVAINSRPLTQTAVNLIAATGENKSSIIQRITDQDGYLYLDNISVDEPINISYFLNIDEKNKISVPDNLTLTFQPMVNFVPLKGSLPFSNYHIVNRKIGEEITPIIARSLTNKNNLLTFKKDEILIEEVQIKASKISTITKLNKELATGLFQSMNSTVFDFVNENQEATSFTNVLKWLEGRAAGLTFQMDRFGSLIPFIRGSEAGLYLDENKVDPSIVSSLSISDIAMVKIFKGSMMLGNSVVIYLRKGNMRSSNEDQDNAKKNKLILAGYSRALKYEQPNYLSDSYKKLANDTRDLLYWNPSLIKESNIPLPVKFLNNDSAKYFKITIISFNADGLPLFYDEIL